MKSLDGAGTNENVCPLRVRVKPRYRWRSGNLQISQYQRRMQVRCGDIIHEDIMRAQVSKKNKAFMLRRQYAVTFDLLAKSRGKNELAHSIQIHLSSRTQGDS